jgi:PhoH-like ATPase
MRKKTYILDTSVYLTDANSIKQFKKNDIIIPLKVLEEIDKHKTRQDGVGAQARQIIRILDELRTKGSLQKGVRIEKGKGLIYTKGYNIEYLPEGFDPKHPDNQIICVALTEKRENPKKKVIVVSRDINMRVKCDAIGIECEEYVASKVVKDSSELYTGLKTILVDEEIVDQFYARKDVFVENEEHNLFANQFVMLVSSSNEKKTALARFTGYSSPLKHIFDAKGHEWLIKPRNKEQRFSLDLLMNPDVPVVTLIGKAGSGKTLAAISAGMEQVLNTERYKTLVVSRPVQPLGKDIGFLPGSMEEKMRPWLAPIRDNLQYLMGNDKILMEEYLSNGLIEVEALTYIRGRSISDAYIIIDEAQNLSRHELKTIITRVGENTKIVLTGDIEQIDNVYIDETTNGLTYAVESFKQTELAGHITLQKGERSKVASLAARIL